jgi:hypothetical protein
MGSLAGWLRSSSEHYLMEAAQRDLAERYLARPGSAPPAGPSAMFWRRVFVPVYRRLPWELRRTVMGLLPGSHRHDWPRRPPRQQ